MMSFLTFLFLIAVDFARMFYTALTIENCAYTGALYGSQTYAGTNWQGTGGQIASVQAAAVADGTRLNPALTSSNVSVTTGGTDANGNSIVVVTVQYTFNTLVTYPGIPSSTTLSRTVQMRVAPTTPNSPS
jgi:Flp pilus assembly protein TadG